MHIHLHCVRLLEPSPRSSSIHCCILECACAVLAFKHARLVPHGCWLCQMPSASQEWQASSSETAACPFPFKTCSPPPAHHHNCTATLPLATILALSTTTPSPSPTAPQRNCCHAPISHLKHAMPAQCTIAPAACQRSSKMSIAR